MTVPTTWNPTDHNTVGGVGVTVSNGDLTWTLTAGGGSQTGLRAYTGGFVGGATGKLFYSMTCVTADGNGFAGMGIANLAPVPLITSSILAAVTCLNGFQFFNGGNTSGNFTYTTGDVIDVATDLSLLLVWFRKNGGAWTSGGDPALGTGGRTIANLSGLSIAPYANLGAGGSPGQWTANFGASAYPFAAPSGFSNWTMAGSVTNASPFFFGL